MGTILLITLIITLMAVEWAVIRAVWTRADITAGETAAGIPAVIAGAGTIEIGMWRAISNR